MRWSFSILLLSGCVAVASEPGVTRDPARCESPPPLTGESQRLDPQELSHALEAVLGFAPDLDGVPAPLADGEYSTSPAANRITFDDARALAEVGERVGLEAQAHYGTLLSCDPAAIDRSCVESFLDDFVPRVYRGSQGPDDVSRLLDLYDTLTSGDEPLPPGLALSGVISAIVQSPGFLYLLEIGEPVGDDVRRLTGREVANRLAFTFLDAPPDAELLAAAESGALDTPEGRRAQAERLIASPEAVEPVTRFFEEWFGTHHVPLESRVTPELAVAMQQELARGVEQRIAEGGAGSLTSLVNGETTWVNRSLAEHYGLAEVPADDDTWVEVPLEEGRRAGLLSSALVSTAHSNISETSIIQRGRFIREVLLCQHLGTPPPGATEMQPETAPDATPRERSELRSQTALCASCHNMMDPIGLGMEDLGPLGRLRTTYESSGREIDATGEIRGLTDGEFAGVEQLGQRLGSDPSFAACASSQWFTYAMGRDEGGVCFGNLAREALEASGGDLREMLLFLVESESFVTRTDGVTAGDSP